MDLGIEGRVALVAGGSSGLGRAAALALAEAGATVSIAARDRGRLDAAADDIAERTGRRPHVASIDVTDRAGVEGWVADVAAAIGRPHIVVANGGGPPPGTATEFDVDDYRAAVETTMLPSIALVQAALPHLATAAWGRIVFVTSIAVKEPIPGLALSNASRAGLLGYARSLVRALPAGDITVNVVAPGVHRTPRLDALSDEQVAAMAADVPSGRVGDPRRFGQVVAFLASEPAAHVNGVVLPVDGGAARGIV